MKPSPRPIPLLVTEPTLVDYGREVARRAGAQLFLDPHDRLLAYSGYLLVLTPERLELRQQGPLAHGPIYVDFVEGRAAHRRRFGGGRGQPLARACALSGGANPTVLDATPGLGRDAFVLATLGAQVHLIERSPVVATLLHDGIARANMDVEVRPIVARLRLSVGEAGVIMAGLAQAERPDVVYLDPMYPARDKSALVKKEMRAFRELVGEDEDAPALLTAALACARRRVVVKRPRGAKPVAGPAPIGSIDGKTTRYDLYRPLGQAGPSEPG